MMKIFFMRGTDDVPFQPQPKTDFGQRLICGDLLGKSIPAFITYLAMSTKIGRMNRVLH